jgi:hypothetical protein
MEYRGCDRTAEPSPLPKQSFWNQKDYPWTLVRLLPNAQHYTVGSLLQPHGSGKSQALSR